MNDQILLWGSLLEQGTAVVLDVVIWLFLGFALVLSVAFVITAVAAALAELGWGRRPVMGGR